MKKNWITSKNADGYHRRNLDRVHLYALRNLNSELGPISLFSEVNLVLPILGPYTYWEIFVTTLSKINYQIRPHLLNLHKLLKFVYHWFRENFGTKLDDKNSAIFSKIANEWSWKAYGDDTIFYKKCPTNPKITPIREPMRGIKMHL